MDFSSWDDDRNWYLLYGMGWNQWGTFAPLVFSMWRYVLSSLFYIIDLPEWQRPHFDVTGMIELGWHPKMAELLSLVYESHVFSALMNTYVQYLI
jgi:hypothetical protein